MHEGQGNANCTSLARIKRPHALTLLQSAGKGHTWHHCVQLEPSSEARVGIAKMACATLVWRASASQRRRLWISSAGSCRRKLRLTGNSGSFTMSDASCRCGNHARRPRGNRVRHLPSPARWRSLRGLQAHVTLGPGTTGDHCSPPQAGGTRTRVMQTLGK